MCIHFVLNVEVLKPLRVQLWRLGKTVDLLGLALGSDES